MAGFDSGPRNRSILVGLAVAQLYASATDVKEATSDIFFGLGAGFRFSNCSARHQRDCLMPS